MNLLLISVCSERSRGGIATWTDRFLKNCEKHDINCTLVNTNLVGRRALCEVAPRSFRDEYVRTRRIFKDLKKALLRSDCDAAHLNTSCGTFGLFRDYLIAKCIKRKGIRLVTHFHCDIPYWVSNALSRWTLRKLLAISDVRLVLCERSRLFLKEKFNISSWKIPNFIDDNMVRFEDKRILQDIRTALYVGRVTKAKGALEIWEIAKRMPEISFRIVGAVSEEVSSWGCPKNITVLGALNYEEVFREMDKADIFVFPSHSEGFSLALTESMARGLPSIATDVGANFDMLSDGCGVIVPEGDVESLCIAIRGLCDPRIRENVSRRAIEKVRRCYTTDKVFGELKKFYQ